MTKRRAPEALNVLFVGNSFTARNDVPGTIERLAEARGRRFGHELVSIGGASLRQHWNKGEAQSRMDSRKFDAVVLQEQSTLPVKNSTRMHENVRLFDPYIKAAGARTILYMTWARRHEPHNQRVIADAYASIGEELGAAVVPVGLAWERVLAEHETIVLHDKDGSHPSVCGSYLAACVFYAAMFGDEPPDVDLGLKGLSPEDASVIRAAAGTIGAT